MFLLLFCEISCEVLAPVQFFEDTCKPVSSCTEGRQSLQSWRSVMEGSQLPRLPVYFGKGSIGQLAALPLPQEPPATTFLPPSPVATDNC